MSRRKSTLLLGAAVIAVLGLLLVLVASNSGSRGGASDSPQQLSATDSPQANDNDPSNWSDSELAAVITWAGVNTDNIGSAPGWVKSGVSGLVLLGTPDSTFPSRIKAIRAINPDVFVSSDEEGGEVQKLYPLLSKLPSAQTMGSTMSPDEVEQLAQQHGREMLGIGVNVALSPVADIYTPTGYIGNSGRAFSSDPHQVAKYVDAWAAGLEAAGVMPVVKHWPGHGDVVANTHTGAGVAPDWSILDERDQIPFRSAIDSGIPAVMVGHLIVPGLTEHNVPATQSAAAIEKLRAMVGPQTLIITDSLTMAAVNSAMKQNYREAAVRAINIGVDVALVNSGDPPTLIRYLTKALKTGTLSRERAVEAARRILAAQQRWAPN